MKIRVRMKRKSELDLTTRDSYFKILVQVFANHILAKNIFYESYRVNRTQDYGLKPGDKYQIIRCCNNFENTLIDYLRHHSISLLSKSFSNIIFANCKDQTINSNIYLLLELLGRQRSIS